MFVLKLDLPIRTIYAARCLKRTAHISDGESDAWCRCRCLCCTCETVNDALQALAEVPFTSLETSTKIKPELLSLSRYQSCNHKCSQIERRNGAT